MYVYIHMNHYTGTHLFAYPSFQFMSLYTCIHVCIFIYVYIYIYVNIYIYTYLCINSYLFSNINTCICINTAAIGHGGRRTVPSD